MEENMRLRKIRKNSACWLAGRCRLERACLRHVVVGEIDHQGLLSSGRGYAWRNETWRRG
ncbi:hypothetical protein KSP40_PGU019587 [Platanthera guangdongensis]|uniref:Uncharacterized protein n=1 Tax=Platanthera guangdongensis TaxID=2320717 RepID=A0ABR2MJQ5_9ASPA